MNSESSDEGPSTPKKKTAAKRKHYAQKYRTEWESEDVFKNWIAPVPGNDFKASCKVCDTILSCETSTLRRHVTTAQDIKVTTMKSKIKNLKSYFSKPCNPDDDKAVRRAEIKFAAFVAEHYLSFLAIDHLTDLFKECFPDSKTAGEIKLKRTKCTAIVKNVIGESQKTEIGEKIKVEKFSVLLDESTDIGSVKYMCVLVKFYDSKAGFVVTSLWTLTSLFGDCDDFESAARDATGEVIYQSILKTFVARDIPLENIIGFASDGCNVMMGQHNSIASRLSELNPPLHEKIKDKKKYSLNNDEEAFLENIQDLYCLNRE